MGERERDRDRERERGVGERERDRDGSNEKEKTLLLSACPAEIFPFLKKKNKGIQSLLFLAFKQQQQPTTGKDR